MIRIIKKEPWKILETHGINIRPNLVNLETISEASHLEIFNKFLQLMDNLVESIPFILPELSRRGAETLP